MNAIIYCHHCKKSASTSMEDILRMQKFDPEHLILSGHLYSYSGGCYFKNLRQLKQIEKRTQRPSTH